MIIGIMGAMPDEVDQLCAKLGNVTVEPYGGVEYHRGTLAGKQVVVCCAGMGKANAAATTQVLITRFGAEKIIFSGIAGNMTSKIGIGDVCVGETVVYHDAQNDMIAQSAPFTAEYHGDPALVKAALDACNACGPGDHYRTPGPAGVRRTERGGALCLLHQERGVPRNLPHLAGERHPGQHPGPDLLRPEPGVYRVLPYPGIRL